MSSKLHDDKYRSARDAGHSGWGGPDRIANLSKMIDERFLNLEGIPRVGHLLEIGCGAGNISIELVKRGYTVTGVDFAETAVAWAQENAVTANVEATFRVADIADLSFCADESFDIVFDGNCLHCLIGAQRDSALREIRRVLKRDGILFVSSLSAVHMDSSFPVNFDSKSRVLLENGTPYRFIPTPEFLESELKGHGFKILQKFVRDGSPFGHTSIHAKKTDT